MYFSDDAYIPLAYHITKLLIEYALHDLICDCSSSSQSRGFVGFAMYKKRRQGKSIFSACLGQNVFERELNWKHFHPFIKIVVWVSTSPYLRSGGRLPYIR